MRSAERRGLLTGHHLSPVQAAAVEALAVLDRAEDAALAGDRIRLALISHGGVTALKALYPALDRPAEKAEPESVEIISEEDLEEDDLDLVFVEPDVDEAMDLLSQVGKGQVSFGVSAADLGWR